MKKSLLLLGIISSLILIPGQSLAQKACEITCNLDFLEADGVLNEVWQDLEPSKRESWKASQRKWIQYRNKKCNIKNEDKRDACLIKETKLRTAEIWEVGTYGEEGYLKLNQKQKDCLAGDGGLACFDKW